VFFFHFYYFSDNKTECSEQTAVEQTTQSNNSVTFNQKFDEKNEPKLPSLLNSNFSDSKLNHGYFIDWNKEFQVPFPFVLISLIVRFTDSLHHCLDLHWY
jgi:hypothetical protein